MIEKLKKVLENKNSALLERIKLYIANYKRNRIAIIGYNEEGLLEIESLLEGRLHDHSVYKCCLEDKQLSNLLSVLARLKEKDILLLRGLETFLAHINEEVCEAVDKIVHGNFNLLLITSPEGADLLEDFDENLIFFRERLNGEISIEEISKLLPKGVRSQQRLIENILGQTRGRIKLSFLAFHEFLEKCWKNCRKRNCDEWCADRIENLLSAIFPLIFGINGWEHLQVLSFKEAHDIFRDLKGKLKGDSFYRLNKKDFETWVRGKTIDKKLFYHRLFQSGVLKNLNDVVVLTPHILDSFNSYFKWVLFVSLKDPRYNLLFRTILSKKEKKRFVRDLKGKYMMNDPYVIEKLHKIMLNHCRNLDIIKNGKIDKQVEQESKIAESKDLVFSTFPFFVYTVLKTLNKDLVIGRDLFNFEKLGIGGLKELEIISNDFEISWRVFPYVFQNDLRLDIHRSISEEVSVKNYIDYINSVVFSNLVSIINNVEKLNLIIQFLFSVLPFVGRKALISKILKSDALKSTEDLTESEVANAASKFLSVLLIFCDSAKVNGFNLIRSISRVETSTRLHKLLKDIDSARKIEDLVEISQVLLHALTGMFSQLGRREPMVKGALKLIYGEENEHRDLYILYRRFYEKCTRKMSRLYLTDASMPRVTDLYHVIGSSTNRSEVLKNKRIERIIGEVGAKTNFLNIKNVALFLLDCYGWFRWHVLKSQIKDIIKDAVDIPFLTVFPTLTPVDVFSILTGKCPAEHGIIDQKILIDSGVEDFVMILDFLENEKGNFWKNVHNFKKFKFRDLTPSEKSILKNKIKEVVTNIKKESPNILDLNFKQVACYEIREKGRGSLLSDVIYKGRLEPTYKLNFDECLDDAEKILTESQNAFVYFYVDTFDYLSHHLREQKQAFPSKASYLEDHIKMIATRILKRILSMNTNDRTLIVVCADHGAVLLPTCSKTICTTAKYPVFSSRIARMLCDYPQKEKDKIMNNNPDVVLDVFDKEKLKALHIYRAGFSPDLLVVSKDDVLFAKERGIKRGMVHGGMSIGEILVPVILARR